jgi:hypothetical protein
MVLLLLLKLFPESTVLVFSISFLLGGICAEWVAADTVRTASWQGIVSGAIFSLIFTGMAIRLVKPPLDSGEQMDAYFQWIVPFGLAGFGLAAIGGGLVWLLRRAKATAQ